MEIVQFSVVKSIAGHDKNNFFVVLKIDGDYALICDGAIRKLSKPKKKKIKHLSITKTILNSEVLNNDCQIRKSLKVFNKQA